jgi:hypothetical protein
MTARRKRSPEVANQDELTLIKGIGEARQQWLRDRLNVVSFQALAALSVEEIEAQLKEDNQIVSRAAIESWIAQAARLAGSSAPRHPAMSRESGWKPVASFVVEFQEHEVEGERRTRVHHVEADKNRMWSGIEHEELCAWMVQQLGGQADQIPEADVEPLAVAESSSVVEVSEVMSSQSIPVGFSEKLQHVLAKAERMRLLALPTITTGAAYQSAQTSSHEHPGGDMSQRLRAVLAKADKLSSLTT